MLSRCWLLNLRNPRELEVITGQSHPRSSILVSIESTYATDYSNFCHISYVNFEILTFKDMAYFPTLLWLTPRSRELVRHFGSVQNPWRDLLSTALIDRLLARALQALSDPYCQSMCLCVCLCVCLPATLMPNISETKGVRDQQGACGKVTIARRLVTSSMKSSDCMTSYSWHHNLQSRCVRKLGPEATICVDRLSTRLIDWLSSV